MKLKEKFCGGDIIFFFFFETHYNSEMKHFVFYKKWFFIWLKRRRIKSWFMAQ